VCVASVMAEAKLIINKGKGKGGKGKGGKGKGGKGKGGKGKGKFCCPYCNKSYHRKLYYDRHYSCCKLIYSSNKKKNEIDLEEGEDIPTRRELYIMVQELSSKYELLLKHTTKLESYVNRKKRQINLLEWLQQDSRGAKQMVPTNHMDYSSWLNYWTGGSDEGKGKGKVHLVTEDMLKCIFESGNVLQGMLNILKYYETSCHTKEVFRVFLINGFGDNEKEGLVCRKMYVFDKAEWRVLKKEEIGELEYVFTKAILKAFKQWQVKHKDEIMNNINNMSEVYQTNLQIVMGGGKLRRDQMKKKFHQLFASYVLQHITNELEIKE
jgi:hypothetical protein